jgi:hypothetical protein
MAMKKILFLSVISLLLFVFSGLAQDCTYFYPMEEGTLIELRHYDKKGKVAGTTRQEIVDKQISGGTITITIKSTFFDEKGKELMTSDLTMACKDGVFTFDMDHYLNDEMLNGLGDMEFTIEGDNLEFPAKMSPGDQLKEGTIKLIVPSMSMMNMTTKVYNRKVEAIEDVTTEAGTFKCYKISYDVFVDGMIDINTKGIEWIAQDAGAVRSETYNKNGKLTGYTELIKLEK